MNRRYSFGMVPLLVLYAAAGCSPMGSSRAQLLTESYDIIQRDYVKPMPASALALTTLRQLTVIDGALAVAANDTELVLKYHGHVARRFPLPVATASHGWGETASDVTAAAAAVSPAVAGLPDDTLDTTLVRGTVAGLDRYSRYIPPQALPESRLVERADAIAVKGTPPAEASPRAAQPPTDISASTAHRSDPSVELRMAHRIAIIRIERFTRMTGELLRRRLAAARRNGEPRGVILDLRDNPGGDIDAAVEVVKLFHPRLRREIRGAESGRAAGGAGGTGRRGRDSAARHSRQRRFGVCSGDRRRGSAGEWTCIGHRLAFLRQGDRSDNLRPWQWRRTLGHLGL
jgi:hypothetical protein